MLIHPVEPFQIASLQFAQIFATSLRAHIDTKQLLFELIKNFRRIFFLISGSKFFLVGNFAQIFFSYLSECELSLRERLLLGRIAHPFWPKF